MTSMDNHEEGLVKLWSSAPFSRKELEVTSKTNCCWVEYGKKMLTISGSSVNVLNLEDCTSQPVDVELPGVPVAVDFCVEKNALLCSFEKSFMVYMMNEAFQVQQKYSAPLGRGTPESLKLVMCGNALGLLVITKKANAKVINLESNDKSQGLTTNGLVTLIAGDANATHHITYHENVLTEWNVKTGAKDTQIILSGDPLIQLDLKKLCGEWYIITTSPREVKLYPIGSATAVGEVKALKEDFIASAAYDKVLAVAERSGVVKLWSWNNSKCTITRELDVSPDVSKLFLHEHGLVALCEKSMAVMNFKYEAMPTLDTRDTGLEGELEAVIGQPTVRQIDPSSSPHQDSHLHEQTPLMTSLPQPSKAKKEDRLCCIML